MTSALDTAWVFLKDFTTDKLRLADNVAGFLYGSDMDEWGKNPNLYLPFSQNDRWGGDENDVYSFQGEPYRKGSSKIKPARSFQRNSPMQQQLITAVLPTHLGFDPASNERKWLGDRKPLSERETMLTPKEENNIIDRIIETLAHEYGHASSDQNVDESMYRGGYGDLNKIPTPEKKRAKEYGAYTIQGLSHDEIQEALKRRGLL